MFHSWFASETPFDDIVENMYAAIVKSVWKRESLLIKYPGSSQVCINWFLTSPVLIFIPFSQAETHMAMWMSLFKGSMLLQQ